MNTSHLCEYCDLPVSEEYDPEAGQGYYPLHHDACQSQAIDGRYQVVSHLASGIQRDCGRYEQRKRAEAEARYLTDWNTPYNGTTFEVVDLGRVMKCPTCGAQMSHPPTEPPIGTWVKDRHGAVAVRTIDSEGRDGWAPAPSGFYAFGRWTSMWDARGPLVECGPWGEEKR